MSDLIIVKAFPYRHEAELAKNLLAAEGIESIIQADDAGGLRPHLTFTGGAAGMANFLVRKEDADKAREVLGF